MKVVIRLSTKNGKTSAHFVGAVSCCGTIMDAIQEKRKQEFNLAQGLVANLMKGVPDGGNQTIKT
jgi:hypothetical protein